MSAFVEERGQRGYEWEEDLSRKVMIEPDNPNNPNPQPPPPPIPRLNHHLPTPLPTQHPTTTQIKTHPPPTPSHQKEKKNQKKSKPQTLQQTPLTLRASILKQVTEHAEILLIVPARLVRAHILVLRLVGLPSALADRLRAVVVDGAAAGEEFLLWWGVSFVALHYACGDLCWLRGEDVVFLLAYRSQRALRSSRLRLRSISCMADCERGRCSGVGFAWLR